MNELKIILPTCDKYLHIIEALAYTINKFWENHGEVIILGYSEPDFDLPPNMRFHSMGKDNGPKSWSNDLLEFFSTFDEEYFINLVDDTLVIRPVDTERINTIFEYMVNNDISKTFLLGSLDESFRSHEHGQLDLMEVKQTSDYRTSVNPAILRTDYFLKYLKPNQTPWQFELQESRNDGLTILSVKKDGTAPLIMSHLYRKNTGLIETWYQSGKTKLILNDEDRKIISVMLNIK